MSNVNIDNVAGFHKKHRVSLEMHQFNSITTSRVAIAESAYACCTKLTCL